jgi:DNA-binding response OmpR family regulator
VDSSNTRGKGGTGLGLSISKFIIEELGGTIHFSSEASGGSTFYFDLPLWHEDTALINGQIKINKSIQPGNKLLICEDDEDQAKYLGALLESAGFHIDLAYRVAQAKKLLAKYSYQALLLDLILPDKDGIAFIRELRTDPKTHALPIIVISIISETGRAVLNGDAFSVLDWLDKPIDLTRLINVIANIKKNSPKKIPHILHVEDDIDTQNIIATLLATHAKVTGVTTLEEAKAAISKEDYDLVILDLLLPDGNGSELLPLFAEHKLSIIVYSAVELDETCSKYVSQELIKSKITNEKLLDILMGFLETS